MGLSPWIRGPGYSDREVENRQPDLSIESGKKRAIERWYRDHPLCGAVIGCEVCPFCSESPDYIRALIPGCSHPDMVKEEYRP